MDLSAVMRRVLPMLVLLVAACVDPGSDENSVRRGDVAFAADSLEEALAEYRLAARQGSDDPLTLARIAHTYVELERVDQAAGFYRQAADLDSRWADQAAADFMALARKAETRQDRFLMATAVDEALEFVPGIGLGDLALPLARHHFRNGEFGRALPLYQRALAAIDTVPRILLEIGQAYEDIGDCRRALAHFELYRERAPRGERDQANWFIGSCALRLARDLREERPVRQPRLQEALRLVNRAIEVGEPRNLQGTAWFERGEILAALGDCQGAMESFEQVRYVEATGAGALVNRARERYDNIKFGEGLERFRRDGGCD